jgi:hypothetical protein
MAIVLHLVKRQAGAVALATIRQQVAAGDRVTVVPLEGAPAPEMPDGVVVRRVPGDVTYDGLLDLVFEADQVLAW